MEISRIPFLKEEECLKIEEQIFSLKPFWINRLKEKGLPFYTLGQASYLDRPESKNSEYYRKAQKQNIFLQNEFKSLYDHLLEVLREKLGKPAVYEERLALPGFHIFLYHQAFTKPLASKHFDLQHYQHQWPYKEVDDKNPISFTLAITLPEKGGGLNYWDITFDEKEDWNQVLIESLSSDSPMHFHPYKRGEIALHKGLYLHQIAPASEMKESDKRITLQGHALFCDGKWRVYW